MLLSPFTVIEPIGWPSTNASESGTDVELFSKLSTRLKAARQVDSIAGECTRLSWACRKSSRESSPNTHRSIGSGVRAAASSKV